MPGRGRNSRRGRNTVTRSTSSRVFSATTVIGAGMPNVWTDRHRSNSMPWRGEVHGRAFAPRIRSRLVVGSSITQVLLRGPSKVVRSIARR